MISFFHDNVTHYTGSTEYREVVCNITKVNCYPDEYTINTKFKIDITMSTIFPDINFSYIERQLEKDNLIDNKGFLKGELKRLQRILQFHPSRTDIKLKVMKLQKTLSSLKK